MTDIAPPRSAPLRDRLAARLPRRRSVLKWVHWSMVPLMIWFVIVTPEVALSMGGKTAFLIHSNLALIFVLIALLWSADTFRRGLAGRPGPKLPDWGRKMHRALHLTLVWGLLAVAVTGFLLGLTSSVQLRAGGFLPFAPPLDLPPANKVVGAIHIVEFYLLAALVVVHAAFHIWRHLHLKDNALRIMVPRALHRFL